jgi:hypothetical protein
MSETKWKWWVWLLVSAALFALGALALGVAWLYPDAIFAVLLVVIASWAVGCALLAMAFIRLLKKAESYIVQRSPRLQRMISRIRRIATKTYPTATPILDLLAPMPKQGQTSFAPGEFAFPILLAVSALASRDATLIIPLMCLWPISLFVTTVHELGHVLAGLGLGFAFKSVAVGPVVVRREEAGFRVALRKALFGGLTYMSLDRFYRVRKRLLLYVAAGPAVGFALAAAAIVGLRAVIEGDHPRLSTFLGALAGLALVSSIQALFPYRGRHLASDGLQLKGLLRSLDSTKRVLAVHALDLERRKGTDRLSLNQRWMRLASSSGELSDSRFSKYREAWEAYWVDNSNEKGAAILESCLAMSACLGEENRDVLILEAAVFTARVRHDSEKARIWFQRVVNFERVPLLTRLRAQATLSFEAGRFDDAIAQINEGLDFLRHPPANPLLDGQEAAWSKWRAEIGSRRDQQAVPA